MGRVWRRNSSLHEWTSVFRAQSEETPCLIWCEWKQRCEGQKYTPAVRCHTGLGSSLKSTHFKSMISLWHKATGQNRSIPVINISIVPSIILSIYASIYMFVYRSVYLSFYCFNFCPCIFLLFYHSNLPICKPGCCYLILCHSIYLYIYIHHSIVLSIILSIYASFCLSFYRFNCSVHVSIYCSIALSNLSVCLSFYHCISFFLCRSIYVCLSIHCSIILSVCHSNVLFLPSIIYLSIVCLSVYPSI